MKFLRGSVPVAVAGVILLAGCGGSSGPAYNQTPAITSIVPSNITAGSQDFTIFISGTGFMSGGKGVSFAYWNGSPRSTSYNTTTGQLEMTVRASDVAVPGQAQITVINPPPGGGEAVLAVSFQVEPAAAGGPLVSSLSPASAAVNAKPPLIAVAGSNFRAGDVVTWNGQSRASTSAYLDQNDMTIQPAAVDLAAPGIASISVGDPGLVIASPSVNFAIEGPSAPAPAIRSLAPASATAGSLDLQVLVKGSGFVFNSTVLWNAVPVATAYLSASELMALVPAADLVSAGSADLAVMTPAPGGGTSNTSTFTIQAP